MSDCQPDHDPGPDCPNVPHTCLICQPKAEARQAVLRDQFTRTLRDGATAVTGDPGFVDAVLAGEICPHCELGLPHGLRQGKAGHTVSSPELPIPLKMVTDVQTAAVQYAGEPVSESAARQIARAVLECTDGEYRSLHSVDAGMWERREVRDSLRQHMRRELFVKLADEGLLPAGWPRELIKEFAGVAGGMVDVELIVPVRRVIP